MSRDDAALRLERPAPGPSAPPEGRGRLLTPEQVSGDLLGGTVTAAWVRRHIPHKVRLGHSTVRYFERDVEEWLESRRVG